MTKSPGKSKTKFNGVSLDPNTHKQFYWDCCGADEEEEAEDGAEEEKEAAEDDQDTAEGDKKSDESAD